MPVWALVAAGHPWASAEVAVLLRRFFYGGPAGAVCSTVEGAGRVRGEALLEGHGVAHRLDGAACLLFGRQALCAKVLLFMFVYATLPLHALALAGSAVAHHLDGPPLFLPVGDELRLLPGSGLRGDAVSAPKIGVLGDKTSRSCFAAWTDSSRT